MFFIYNINTLCFRTIDNEKRKNIYFYLFSFVVCLFSFFSRRYCNRERQTVINFPLTEEKPILKA